MCRLIGHGNETMKDDRIKAERTRRLNLILAGKSKQQKYNEWLRDARFEMELSQSEMAEYIGINPTDYRGLEWGARTALTSRGEWSTPAKKTAAFFDVKPHEIFGDGPNGVEPHEALLIHGDFSRKAATGVSDKYEKKELLRLLGEALKILSEREEKIIRMRLGLDGEPMSLRDIGKVFGLSGARVGQIETKCLSAIRYKFAKLREFHHWNNVILYPCGECHGGASTVFRCKACDRQVCQNCWQYDRGLCRDCAKSIRSTKEIREHNRMFLDRCEAGFQRVKKKQVHVRARETRERREAKQKQTKIFQEHVREVKGFLPQCVEDVLDGYFKRLEDRAAFARQIARGRYYYQAKLKEINDGE
jgi:transcriptional regulator with XRE-family HTH domain